MLVRYLVYLLWLSSASILMAQGAQQTTLQALLDKTDSVASLTSNGTPFHAEMKISGAKKEPQYEGSIIVDWASPTKYRLEVRSVNFHQVQIVDGEQIEEHSDGDFYPGWLHSFVTALLSPMFVKPLLLEPKASIGASRSSNGTTVKLCVDRNDSPGGIRNDMVWSGICVNGEGLLLSKEVCRQTSCPQLFNLHRKLRADQRQTEFSARAAASRVDGDSSITNNTAGKTDRVCVHLNKG
jgi:hypothetical protein